MDGARSYDHQESSLEICVFYDGNDFSTGREDRILGFSALIW